MPTLLALETSCDESAAAVVCNQTVLASAVATQMEEHARWGGVVPEIASRRHVEALPHLIEQVMAQSGVSYEELDAIAATAAPGLVGALLIGSVTGRSLARLHGKPFLGVHHLEGHLCSVQLGDPLPPGPYLVLLVSGGHTEMIRVDGPGDYTRLARSRDDAAGEAFDKVARASIPTTSASAVSRRRFCGWSINCGPRKPPAASRFPWRMWRRALSRWSLTSWSSARPAAPAIRD